MRARLFLGWLVVAALVIGCDTTQPIRQEQQVIELSFRATSATVQEIWTWRVYEDSDLGIEAARRASSKKALLGLPKTSAAAPVPCSRAANQAPQESALPSSSCHSRLRWQPSSWLPSSRQRAARLS